uniref:Zinc finger CCCH domain-containing protein 6 n=1 Tax=Anthurium amnicola TaxID=1678845 RepID=A0A1D1Z5I7_9ARAE
MARSKQSKRVSWAPDVKLCQVRLFLSEDTPQSGSGAQDHLQAKASWLQHSREVSSDESLPPGFEALLIPYQSKGISQIPTIKWKAPLKFLLNREWLVVAGEESEEVRLQNQRQLGVFEAIYPRPSSIPPNPVVSEVKDSHNDDARIPLIPITAIEDEDLSDELDSQAAIDASGLVRHSNVTQVLMDTKTPSMSNSTLEGSAGSTELHVPTIHNSEKQVVSFIPSVEPDVVAAASAAFTALMRSSEEGSLIDPDLLIKILSDPILIGKLVAEYGMPGQQHPPPVSATTPAPPAASPAPANLSAPLPTSQMGQFDSPQNAVLCHPTNSQTSPTAIQITANPIVSGPQVRDMSYLKTLIQQHGGDKQEVVDSNHAPFDGHCGYPFKALGGNDLDQGIQASLRRDSKPKIPKPCIYFNSPRGCRRGADCLYVHDVSLPRTIERQSRKKIKLDKETIRRV